MTITKCKEIQKRKSFGANVARDAGNLALRYYRDPAGLNVRNKGVQDQVSVGDIEVERFIRRSLHRAFPEDGIIGEEEGIVFTRSGFTWVIDPIDGTSNFVRGAPGWCVVLCCVDESRSLIGVVFDPIADECFVAVRGQGGSLNGTTIHTSSSTSLSDGSIGVGMSNRAPVKQVIHVLDKITAADGLFYRNGSGALNLAYVASARLSGYCEPHMNAWDCLAGMLLIEEAGGIVEEFELQLMLENGGRVIAGCAGIYDQLLAICQESFMSPV